LPGTFWTGEVSVAVEMKKPKELAKGTIKAYLLYNDMKEKATEDTFCFVERSNPFYFIVFAGFGVYCWYVAIYFVEGFEQLYSLFSVYSIAIVFLVSYLTFFLGSKLVFRMTVEEAEDDTSTFALFSACRRRERRSLLSAGLAAINTGAIIFYLVEKDIQRLWIGRR
jgi:hypothetical protein